MEFKYPAVSELTFSENTERALRLDPYLGRKLAGLARDLHQVRIDAREHLSELSSYFSDRSTGYKVGTADWMTASKAALEDPKTPAGALLIAARNVLGPGLNTFEPDTFHVELEQREKLKVPSVNHDKLMAAIVLTDTPAFYFEANCFKNTVMALNNEPVDVEVLQEPTPAQIAWAVYECEIILHENSLWEPMFEDDPAVFTATVLYRDGMILAPEILSFCQDVLDKMNLRSAAISKDEVKTAWENLKDRSKLKEKNFSESALHIQLGKLSACQIYMSEQADSYQSAISKLTK